MATNPHDGSLSRDPSAVNPAGSDTSPGRTGLFGFLKLSDFWDLEDREAAIRAAGGEELRQAEAAAVVAREQLETSLLPEQVGLYKQASDARSDATSLREDAARSVALTFGIAAGATLAVNPDEDPAILVRGGFKLGAALSLMGRPAAREVLRVMDRAASLE